MEIFKVLVYCFLLFHFIPTFNTLETILPGQSIQGNETLISTNGTFEAGFFNFDNSNNQYFGIWYKDISPRTVVWIANRDSPLENSSGVLNLTDKGTLVIVDDSKVMIWSSNKSTTAAKPILQLLENGNLVVKDETKQDNILWQSFDFPGDTLLPGMSITSSLVNGDYKGLVSWRNTQDPSTGLYSYYIDTNGFPQVVIKKGNTLVTRVGSWNGYSLSGFSSVNLYKTFSNIFVITEKEVSYGYELLNNSTVSRYLLDSEGQITRYFLSDDRKSWQIFFIGPIDQCDNYAKCGANSYCDTDNSPICECLDGFIPKSREKWNSQNWTDGCVRRVKLVCDDNSDGFLKQVEMKLPDTSKSWFNKSINLEECERFCLRNCSCTAYANLDIRDGGSGCLIWFKNILDVKKLSSGGQDFYMRVAASELAAARTGLNKKKIAGILVGCIMFVVIMIILGVAIHRVRKKKLAKQGNNQPNNNDNEDIDIPIFDLSTIANATNSFSIDNKLGQGGFGPVYKGKLENGQDIAVKRLCNTSGQGPKEFINEVKLIANLQHRNLVKLLGCCIQNDEKLLIYEFMTNTSLDYFTFDQTRKSLLHWTRRFQIIRGIARGLVYLHEDSRLRIIHRDLKTSNILLDENMNPKISDFGLARTLWGDEAKGETRRIVGTHGYMSPEYAARGFFSVKSDVFSFGVIILETISGKKNRQYSDYHDLDLLGYAWRMWCEKTPLELIDESLSDSIVVEELEIMRCIQIGLLCVQERADDRPSMSAAVLMLNGEKTLPEPKEPAFYPRQFGSSSGGPVELHSNNEVSMTSLQAR
ncbi:G-type lectin S-receptor-like serine/threonine-protein kinase At4g27290 isoform X1 [Vicia villosa]|uniref:G-type lectin S-receptor-like serine/threonine-protein kinase At4g27290 isoform X1 n=1 Tax=Vicia villosa TaxID=3911 RepID=UPI00273B8A82|nr:G-type lectin S-receptor-like serine/threonine-protein kinase At4g27290 isoform X1 [Vicia villosa]